MERRGRALSGQQSDGLKRRHINIDAKNLTHAVLIRFVLRCFCVAPLSRLYLPTSSRLPALFIHSFIFIHEHISIYPHTRLRIREPPLPLPQRPITIYCICILLHPRGTPDMKDNRMDPLSCHLIYVLLTFISVFRGVIHPDP